MYTELVMKMLPQEFLRERAPGSTTQTNRGMLAVACSLGYDLYWGAETEAALPVAASMLSLVPLDVLNTIADRPGQLSWRVLSWARMASTEGTMLEEPEYSLAKKCGLSCGVRLVHIATRGCLGLMSPAERRAKHLEGTNICAVFPRVLQDYGMNREESATFVRRFSRVFSAARTYDQSFPNWGMAADPVPLTPGPVVYGVGLGRSPSNEPINISVGGVVTGRIDPDGRWTLADASTGDFLSVSNMHGNNTNSYLPPVDAEEEEALDF